MRPQTQALSCSGGRGGRGEEALSDDPYTRPLVRSPLSLPTVLAKNASPCFHDPMQAGPWDGGTANLPPTGEEKNFLQRLTPDAWMLKPGMRRGGKTPVRFVFF